MESLRLTQCRSLLGFSPTTIKVRRTSYFPRTQIIQAKATQHTNEIHISNTNTTLTLAPIISSSSSFPICGFGEEEESNNNDVSLENLDEWIRDSVSEIVRNIGEAPFLMQVYSKKMKTGVEVEREKETVDVWASVKRRWKEGCPIPDGVILVEQLDGDKDDDGNKKMEDLTARTREWGVLIQGRGIDCPSCYILKTCRVWSSIGFCTHFCLVRAKCFGETAELQLQNSWNGISN